MDLEEEPEMSTTLPIDSITSAWSELEKCLPVRLAPIEDKLHYALMSGLLDTLSDEVGDRHDHPLEGLLEVVTFLMVDFEELPVDLDTPA